MTDDELTEHTERERERDSKIQSRERRGDSLANARVRCVEMRCDAMLSRAHLAHVFLTNFCAS